MKLKINELLNYEIIHHYDENSGDEIKSTGNNFYIKVQKYIMSSLITNIRKKYELRSVKKWWKTI